MLGINTCTPKPDTLFETRPLRTTSIDQVLSSTEELELRRLEPYHESSFWLLSPENTVTTEDIAPLYRYKYGQNFTYHTPSEKSNSIWYTHYPHNGQRSSHYYEVPEVWGGNKR